MSSGTGEVVNPLDPGNDSHSVETAAEDFTAMLREEGQPAPRPKRERAPAAPSPEKSDNADERGDGQTERQPPKGEREEPADEPDQTDESDPILDDTPEAKPAEEDKGEDDEDGPDDEDDEESDEDEDDEESDNPDAFLDKEFEVTVNGEKLKVTGREALAGYQKDADYRQGTERNAREYEEIQNYAKETVEVRQRTDTTLTQAMALIEALQPSKEDWDALERDNPQGYISAQKHWAGLIEKAQGIAAAKERLSADQVAQTEAEQARYAEQEERELIKKFPALRDEKKADAFRSSIFEYGRKAGWTDKELVAGAIDHRTLITLYKAAQYDKIRDTKAAAGKKASSKAPKNSAENRARPPSRNTSKNARREADRRLQRTGSLQDAAASFAELVRSER